MAAHLKRLEGMVREVKHTQQEQPTSPPVPNTALPEGQEEERPADTPASLPVRTVLTAPRESAVGESGDVEEPLAQVVMGKDGQGTCVGATHFTAMLDDVNGSSQTYTADVLLTETELRTSEATLLMTRKHQNRVQQGLHLHGPLDLLVDSSSRHHIHLRLLRSYYLLDLLLHASRT